MELDLKPIRGPTFLVITALLIAEVWFVIGVIILVVEKLRKKVKDKWLKNTSLKK